MEEKGERGKGEKSSSSKTAIETHIIPKTHNQHHRLRHRSTHTLHAPLCIERLVSPEHLLLGIAEPLCDGVPGHTSNLAHGIRNDFPILDVEALNLAEGPVTALEELRHDRDLAGCVDGELGARSVKGRVAEAIAVEVAAIRVAVARVAVLGICAAAAVARAGVVGAVFAWVGCEGRGDVVGFPDVHFGAAGA